MSERTLVIPNNDLKSHVDTGEWCHCQPRIETAENGNKIVIHNAYDGREFYERTDDVGFDRIT
jgi:hypothetical protein